MKKKILISALVGVAAIAVGTVLKVKHEIDKCEGDFEDDFDSDFDDDFEEDDPSLDEEPQAAPTQEEEKPEEKSAEETEMKSGPREIPIS